jgi:hypothetical protein
MREIFPGMSKGLVLALVRRRFGSSAGCMQIRTTCCIGVDRGDSGWTTLFTGATWAEAAFNMTRAERGNKGRER